MTSSNVRSKDSPPDSGRRSVKGPESAERSGRLSHRLDEILRALPSLELAALIRRMKITIDPAKRIDAPTQVARVLVALSDVRDYSRLPAMSRELLHRIAEAGGALIVPSLPPGLEPLIANGVVYGQKLTHGIELVLPMALLLQLRSWEGEDPRALRALLAQAPPETLGSIASHYLERPATSPIALSIESAWETLRDDARLRAEIAGLPLAERRLLETIEEVGGEVETPELLDIEREPMRLRGAGGVAPSRRGAGFALERRAFLIPVHPNRHIIPTEVALIIGEERRRSREERREQIRSFILEEDHAPRRARFAVDPATLSVAVAIAVRESTTEVRSGVGTPRSLVTRFAQRFGREVEAVSLLAALSRAVGLWDPSALSLASPPGAWTLHDLARMLFATWRKGGTWDEARLDREVLRLGADSRDSSPIGGLRTMVLDALADLGEGRWVPWQALSSYLLEDERVAGAERLLRRWAERTGVELPAVAEVTRRIALETLPVLGIVDLGGTEDALGAGVTLRLTPWGRALLAGASTGLEPHPSKFIDTHALRIGRMAQIASILALAPFAEIGKITDYLDLLLTPQALARALSAGVESDMLRARIEAIAPMPETISRMLVQANTVIGTGSFVASSGFLWIDDEDLRELLRTRKPAAELFVDPSPPGGLLIRPNVELERLVRRCRALGVELTSDGETLRTRSIAPGSGESRAASRPRTTKPPPRSRS
jgi:hypothetical protein